MKLLRRALRALEREHANAAARLIEEAMDAQPQHRDALSRAFELLRERPKPRYAKAAQVVQRVLDRLDAEPVPQPSSDGPPVGVWIQEFLTADWTPAQRTGAIRQAEAMGCRAFALCALPVWESGRVVDQMLGGRDLRTLARFAKDLHRDICEEIMDAGMVPILYGWHGAQARGDGYAHLVQGNDCWQEFADACDELRAHLPAGVLWVDGVEPYTDALQPAPPWGEYQAAMVWADYHHAARSLSAWDAWPTEAPEIHVNAGEDTPQSDLRGGIMATDGGFGHGQTDRYTYRLPSGGTVVRAYACLAGGGLAGNLGWFQRDYARNQDRDFYLVLFTGGWDGSGDGTVYPLVCDLKAEPWRQIIETMTGGGLRDEVDLSKARIVGRRGAADPRAWPVTAALTVTAFREGHQQFSPVPFPTQQVGGGPNVGTMWVGRSMPVSAGVEFAPVEHVLPGQTVGHLTAHHVQHFENDAWSAWPLIDGEVLYFFISSPAMLGAVGQQQRTNVVRATWGV